MLFTALENLGFNERTPSTSFFFSIAGDIHYVVLFIITSYIPTSLIILYSQVLLKNVYSTRLCLMLYELLIPTPVVLTNT